MGANTLRALASDLGYLEAWCRAATGKPLPRPATEALALKFVAHHLWDPVQRKSDRRDGPADAKSVDGRRARASKRGHIAPPEGPKRFNAVIGTVLRDAPR
jgi:hypothetical protein